MSTDDSGRFSMRATTKRAGSTARMLYVEAGSKGTGFTVTAQTNQHVPYLMRTPARRATGATQSVALRPASGAKTVNGAFAAADAMVTGVQLKKVLGISGGPATIPIRYPVAKTAYRAPDILLQESDVYRWDVILHEYGHHLEDIQLIWPELYGDQHSWTTSMDDLFAKGKAGAIAWQEGLASYLAVAGQRALGVGALGIPGAGDTAFDRGGPVQLYSNAGLSSLGEANELAIARTLARFEGLGGSMDVVVNALKKDRQNIFYRALPGLLDAVSAARFDDTNDDPYALGVSDTAACGLEANSISPKLLTPEAGAFLGEDSPPTLKWRAAGGGVNYRLNRFSVQFWSANFDTKLFESGPVSATAWTPSDAEWTQIYWAADAAGTVPTRMRIVIKGSNLSSPVTGPYKSCSVEVAKPEITVEPAGDDFVRPQPFGTCADFDDQGYLDGSDRVRVSGRGWSANTAYTVSLVRTQDDHDPIPLGSLTTDADGSVEDRYFDIPAMPGGKWQLVASAGRDKITQVVPIVVYRCLYYRNGASPDTQFIPSWGGMGAKPASTVTESYYPVPIQATATADADGDFEGTPYTVSCVNGMVNSAITIPSLDGDVHLSSTRPCTVTRTTGAVQTERHGLVGLVQVRR
ncbi:MAG: hypothetical protein V9G19_25810 [Tetrasphaera sp.]